MKAIKLIILTIALCLPSILLSAENVFVPIEGIYVSNEISSALQIQRLSDGNFIFRMVLLKPNGQILPFETQSAFAMPSDNNVYVFYWHTGRYENIPGSDSIIVYRLTYDGSGTLTGRYFFPEKPDNPSVKVTFRRN
ncbi:MAG TPA: hypothetical protein VMV44_07145 [Rectinemataceae bacterium]|nr:hypothetical protein [Rectinemataceae bacterium]